MHRWLPFAVLIIGFAFSSFGAYLLGSELFLKRSSADPRKTYADFGCSFETFTNADFLERTVRHDALDPLIARS